MSAAQHGSIFFTRVMPRPCPDHSSSFHFRRTVVKLREMAEKAKAAKEAGGVVAEEERPAAAEPEVEQRRRGLPAALSILSPKRALPVCAAAGATAFVLQRRRTELQRLTDEIESAIEALRELTGSSRRIETPPPGNIRTQRASLTEVSDAMGPTKD